LINSYAEHESQRPGNDHLRPPGKAMKVKCHKTLNYAWPFPVPLNCFVGNFYSRQCSGLYNSIHLQLNDTFKKRTGPGGLLEAVVQGIEYDLAGRVNP